LVVCVLTTERARLVVEAGDPDEDDPPERVARPTCGGPSPGVARLAALAREGGPLPANMVAAVLDE
jgi:hypothetical protein